MKCLITGVGGFIGYHLSTFLQKQGVEVVGIRRKKRGDEAGARLFEGDILDRTFLSKVLRETSPSIIYHLAAQSLPVLSWQRPQETFEINVIGTTNLLESVRQLGLKTRIVFCGSSSEYAPSDEPIQEDQRLEPSSPYAASKIAGSMMSKLYHTAYNTDVVIVRPFFIIGPRKIGDVCSTFAKGIVDVERGRCDFISVGNLSAVRDFLDVRDASRAFQTVSEKGVTGEVYNICSGNGCKIETVLHRMISRAQYPIDIRHDQSPRPIDLPIAIGANDKLRSLGWNQEVSLEESLASILEYWRGNN